MEQFDVKKPRRFPYAEALLYEIKKAKDFQSRHGFDEKKSAMMYIYWHFFSMVNQEKVNDYLEYLKDVATGKDEHWGAEGKNSWFAVFHKALRQTDFFEGMYRLIEEEPFTKKERSEFNFLWEKVSKEGYKKESKVKGQLFNDEYSRYLELSRKKRERKTEKPVGGHMDMLLYEFINFDDCELAEILKKVFEYKF